uniref:Cephalosporin hydroxylase n=1 Tax=Candidatus Kentrum sp. LFY TaxID=2126342 RepID=A0A450WBE7_9GAMM|nr:MAG: Cephalosporin hydroxylase [Candidatus Kentron sp. LFY]
MTNINDFSAEVSRNINFAAKDRDFLGLSNIWVRQSIQYNYAYNFSWLGRPIIQIPQDIYIIQEIAWKVKPDLIIETGIAHGGSLILSASVLALLDYCDAINQGKNLEPTDSKRCVLGIDIEIRPHNREAIESHPMAHLIKMIEGSSITPDVVQKVKTIAKGYKKVLVFLDSNHTHDHVLAELKAYAPLTSVGSYCVVWDTGIEDLPENSCADRPWGKGNNPKTAIYEYLKTTDCFEIDRLIPHKLLLTASPDGYLKRIAD